MPGGRGVGLYFEESKVYAVELQKEFGEIQITRSSEAEVAPAGAESPSAALASAARRALEKARIAPHGVVLALPEKEAMVRYFEMPLVPRKEWANAVRFEAQKYVPFDMRDLYFDYDLFVDRVHRRLGVAFVAARKSGVDEIVEALRVQGVRLAAIETASIALVRSLQLPDGREVRALVYRDGGAVTTVVFKQSSVLMSRTGGAARGARTEEAPKPAVETLVSEIRLAFNYFSKNFKNEVIKRLVIAAEPGDGDAWAAAIHREFGLTAQTSSSVSALGKGKTLSPGMTVAAGLAMRDVRRESGKKISLMPRETARLQPGAKAQPTPEEEEELLKKWAVREAIVAAVLLAAAFLYFSGRVADERKMLAASRILPAKSATANTGMTQDQLRAKLAELEARENFLVNYLDKRPSVKAKLDEISRTIPDELRLSSLDVSSGEDKAGFSPVSLRMDGFILMKAGGSELALANRFVNALKQSPAFKDGVGEIKLTTVKKSVGPVPGYFSVDCAAEAKG